jgi:hypothetical protein
MVVEGIVVVVIVEGRDVMEDSKLKLSMWKWYEAVMDGILDTGARSRFIYEGLEQSFLFLAILRPRDCAEQLRGAAYKRVYPESDPLSRRSSESPAWPRYYSAWHSSIAAGI